jgi:amidase
LRIGLLLDAPTGLPVDGECVAAARKLATVLEGLGHDVYPVSPALYSAKAAEAFQIIVSASLHASDYENIDLVDPYIKYRLELSKEFHAGQYAQGAALLQLESRPLVEQWGRDFDVLLTPTMACETPEAGVVYDEANNNPAGPRLTELKMISFTSFCNISGLPAINLPVHTSSSGMPVGAQLVGGPFQEGMLIRLAGAVEQVVDWTRNVAPQYP